MNPNPLDSLGWSAVAACVPLAILMYGLIIKRAKGYKVALVTLLATLYVAIFIFNMPPIKALCATALGGATGLIPIVWIVLNAVFLYKLTEFSGAFVIIKDYIGSISEDRRIQTLLIAFCLGAFLEGATGFGAPVAITAGILVGLGFRPLYAAALCLIANTAPVAFGGVGIPVLTASSVSGIAASQISKVMALQLPILAFIVPFWLVVILAGWRKMLQIWPALLVTGGSFSISMGVMAFYAGPTLPNIVSSLVALLSLIVLLKFWQPKEIWRFPKEVAMTIPKKYKKRERLLAFTPYLLLILFVAVWGSNQIVTMLRTTDVHITIPSLSASYTLPWLSSAGTAVLCAAVLSMAVSKISIGQWFKLYGKTVWELRFSILTVVTVLAFAFVANYSGMITAIGLALATTGILYPFVTPFIGWLGVFITGSDTSSAALFSGMQVVAAHNLHLPPELLIAANSAGGVSGKMISPQSIAVASAASGQEGTDGTLLRMTILHSLAFVTIMGVIAYVQATTLLPWLLNRIH